MYDQILDLRKFAKGRSEKINGMLDDVLNKVARNKSRKIYLSINPDEMEGMVNPDKVSREAEVGLVVVDEE